MNNPASSVKVPNKVTRSQVLEDDPVNGECNE